MCSVMNDGYGVREGNKEGRGGGGVQGFAGGGLITIPNAVIRAR